MVSRGTSQPSLPFSVIPVVAIRQTESDPVSFADGAAKKKGGRRASPRQVSFFLGIKWNLRKAMPLDPPSVLHFSAA